MGRSKKVTRSRNGREEVKRSRVKGVEKWERRVNKGGKMEEGVRR